MTPTETTSDYKSPSRKGDISEIDICLHFLNMGYEVFKNMGCSGPVDFIVLDRETGEVSLYDAKTPVVYEMQNSMISVGTSSLNAEQKKLGVRMVTQYNGTVYEGDTKVKLFFDANGDIINGEVKHRNEYTVDEKGTLIRNNTYKVSKNENSK